MKWIKHVKKIVINIYIIRILFEVIRMKLEMFQIFDKHFLSYISFYANTYDVNYSQTNRQGIILFTCSSFEVFLRIKFFQFISYLFVSFLYTKSNCKKEIHQSNHKHTNCLSGLFFWIFISSFSKMYAKSGYCQYVGD